MKPKSPSRPKYWRSLSELEGDPAFQEYVQREFPTPTEQTPLSSKGRRRFVQLMGASFALAGCHWKEEKLLPYTNRPDGVIPGVPGLYSTMMDVGGVATGLMAKSFDGRPIKIEGNPNDTVSKGGTGTFHQAAILGLYDPDRSSKVLQGKTPSNAKTFDAALLMAFAAANEKSGAGFSILSRASSSPTLAALKAKLAQEAPEARWVAYEAADSAGPRKGAQLAFGKNVQTVLHVEKADVLVALDSDLLCAAAPGGIGHSRDVASRRDPDVGKMSRIYSVESTLSEIGSLADHRVTVRPSAILTVAAYIDAKVSAARSASDAQKAPEASALGDAEVLKVVDVLVKDLVAHAGKSLVVAGAKHPPEVHALVHRINNVLGNVGSTVTYHDAPDTIVGGVDELTGLVADMESGKVTTLLILGGNPVYDAPVDLGFEAALSKVKTSFHVGLYNDETARRCSWHAPEVHFLETWTDGRAIDGTTRIGQPLIDPILGGRSSLEILAKLLGLPQQDPQTLVRNTLGIGSDKAWRRAVHDGVSGVASPEIEVELQALTNIELTKSEGLEVMFDVDPAIYDGRFANNGWLQELPHPLAKLAWENAALVAPETAKEQGLVDGSLCKVTVEGRSIELPCIYTPGQAEGTIALALGYGRTEAGAVAGSSEHDVEPVGVNTYLIRNSNAPHFVVGASVVKSGGRQELAITQSLWAIDDVGKEGRENREDVLVRETTVHEYQSHPDVVKHMVHHPPLLNLWKPPISYDGHKWGMAVDLNKCTGCSACMVACQSENNIAVVGKHEMAMGRELGWMRVERYYKGSSEDAVVRQQPVMCQQCENAPCEQVCPVGATMHTEEGLNDMVYNRCIGTRYCSNNCPYKVRRFNYRNYNKEFYGMTPYTGTDDESAKLKSMAFNPEVTVRGRGVMEKCTFCVQRIQNTKIDAKNKKRPIEDGEIKTACEQACPTGAIVFGDLNDPKSRVRAAQQRPRAYELLQELNNRPRVNYMARISNPHPELSTTDGHSDHH